MKIKTQEVIVQVNVLTNPKPSWLSIVKKGAVRTAFDKK
jgi:hypothetical protein